MAFFLLWQFEAAVRDEIRQQRGENTGLLEAFNLSSQAVKMTRKTSGGHLQMEIKKGNKARNQTIQCGVPL